MDDLQLIDFHTHVLPGIDDGSRDEAMTEAMLREEARQGVAMVVATPHFYAHRMSMDVFLEKRKQSLERAEHVLQTVQAPMPEIMAGAEVYYFRGMGRADGVPRLCIGNTRTLLLEMPFEQWDGDVLRDVKDLLHRQELNIVIAHIERYHPFQKDKGIWDQVFELPVIPQINAGSFIRKGGFLRIDRTRRFCMGFVKERPDIIIGTDCHNTSGRAPNLARGREEIATELGPEALRRIDEATRKALEPQ